MKIAVAGYDKRFIEIVYMNHRVQDKFRVNVAFYFPVRKFQCRFKHANIAALLKIFVKPLIAFHITNTKKCFRDTIFVFQIYAKTREIQFPSLRANAKI